MELHVVVAFYELAATLFCVLLFLIVLVLMMRRSFQQGRDLGPEGCYLPLIALVFAYIAAIGNIYIQYFGIPKGLTFGYQIGKILPASCEHSMPIEGESGLPCQMKRFLAWLERAMNDDGSWHLDELEADWKMWFIWAGLSVGFAVATFISVALLERNQARKRRAKEAEEEKLIDFGDDGA